MKNRTYRKIAVKEVDVTALAAELGVGRAVFAIDVAKVDRSHTQSESVFSRASREAWRHKGICRLAR
jgi:hypothetical protein